MRRSVYCTVVIYVAGNYFENFEMDADFYHHNFYHLEKQNNFLETV